MERRKTAGATVPGSATYSPTETVTTHRDTFVPMCRQVFGLADEDLAIRLLTPASQPFDDQCDVGAFVSALPLRGSSGVTPDSLLSPTDDHIWTGTDQHNISG